MHRASGARPERRRENRPWGPAVAEEPAPRRGGRLGAQADGPRLRTAMSPPGEQERRGWAWGIIAAGAPRAAVVGVDGVVLGPGVGAGAAPGWLHCRAGLAM